MTVVILTGKPVTFQRPGQSPSGRRYTPTKYRVWKEAFAWEALASHDGPPHDDAIIVGVEVAPNGIRATFAPVGRRFTMDMAYRTTRPKGLRGDLDNYLKAVLDAAQGVVFHDDRQVVSVHACFRDVLEPTEMDV